MPSGGSRPGSGRPKKKPEEKKKRRTVYLTDRQWDHCYRLLNSAQELEASTYIGRLIDADMKKFSKVNSLDPGVSDLKFVGPGPVLKSGKV